MAFGSREASQHFWKHGEYVATSLGHPQIYLASHFLENLKDHEGSRSQLPSEHIELIHLRLAITLCHELAHIVWLHRLKMDASVTNPSDYVPEPLHNPLDHSAELGHSFERHVFGGSIFSTVGNSLVIGYYSPPDSSRIVVPAWYVNMWFRKALWQPDVFDRLFEQGELKLPSASESGYVILTQHKPPEEDIDFSEQMYEVFIWPHTSHLHPNMFSTRTGGVAGKQRNALPGLLAAVVKQDRLPFPVANERSMKQETDHPLPQFLHVAITAEEDEEEESDEEQYKRLTLFQTG
jgi:hypothetical protein